MTSAAAADRPNIVWIFPDEWRWNAVGYAGNPVVRTPHVDALARRGTAFTSAYCEAPLCQPSRASLLTVSYPRDHGKVSNGWRPEAGAFPAPAAPNFLHRLQAAGYRTGEVGKMHFFSSPHTDDDLKAYGFDDVAEEYDKIMHRAEFVAQYGPQDTAYARYLDGLGLLDDWRVHQDEQTTICFGRDPEGRRALPDALGAEHALDTFIGRGACDLIDGYAGADQPFFLWVGFVGPHVPFDGPPPFADLYAPEDIPLEAQGSDGVPDNRYGKAIQELRDLLNAEHLTERDVRLIGKHYYASVSLVDAAIGRIVTMLEQRGLADNTWILVSSDHGELIGDHGLLNKGVFYAGAVRVPVLAVPPRGQHPGAGLVDGFVQGIDVPATILDVAGADGSGLRGRSLRSVDGGHGRGAVFSQVSDFAMVGTERYRLVVTTDTVEPQALFDLAADPDERVNAVDDPAYAGVRDELVDTLMQPYLAGEAG